MQTNERNGRVLAEAVRLVQGGLPGWKCHRLTRPGLLGAPTAFVLHVCA